MGIIIGILGLTFSNPNKGCMALAYSFYSILKEVIHESDLSVSKTIVFSDTKYLIGADFQNEPIEMFSFSMKNVRSLFEAKKKMNSCTYIFDFTEGDSFTDLYGKKRLTKYCVLKELAIQSGTRYIMCPQTYGPYDTKLFRYWVKRICNKSFYICARDNASSELIESLTKKNIDTFTDVAFALPAYSKSIDSNCIKIGINISGLLWNGGYNKENQFGLKLDYKLYCIKLIEQLLESKQYRIYLIPHVYGDNVMPVENDYLVCLAISELFCECEVAPLYDSPIDIKGFIKGMDLFIGARMHATIAAFSSRVVTIPVAYSRKFDGLYNTINYPYLIDAKSLDTDEALKITLEFIKDRMTLIEAQDKSLQIVKEKMCLFKSKIKELICEKV